MTVEELEKLLSRENIPRNSFSLNGGVMNDCLCLEKTCIGWRVYYTEMGIIYSDIGFPSESDACEYFYKRIMKMTEV
jgi:hypothetical protein